MSIGAIASHYVVSAPAGYAGTVLADSPLGFWKCEETTGTTLVDASGNSHDGVINGTPTLGASTVMPSGARAITLDSASKHLNLTAAAWLNVSPFSVEAWVRLTSLTSYHNVFNRDGTLNRGWNVYLKDGVLSAFDGVSDHLGVATITTGTAHHIVATNDGTTVKLYLDGSLDFSFSSVNGWASNVSSAAGTNSFVNDLSIGASLSGGSYSLPLVGDIDYVAYYGAALSSTQVAAHYAAR